MTMDKRMQMIRDRHAHIEFTYNTGKMVSKRILSNDSEGQKLIDLCIEVDKMCSEYPENEYGRPCLVDIMAEAFRYVNYVLENIDKSGGRSME